MIDEDTMTLQAIRKLADKARLLESKYMLQKQKATDLKKDWESSLAELTDLCRSHETSEEVAERPLIKAVERKADESRMNTCGVCGCMYSDLNESCPECAHQAVNDHFAEIEREADGEVNPKLFTEVTEQSSLAAEIEAKADEDAQQRVSDHFAAVEREADGEYSEADIREGELWDAEDATDPTHNTMADGEGDGIVDGIDALRQAGGSAWDEVADPEAYLSGGDLVTSRPGVWPDEVVAEKPAKKRRKAKGNGSE